MESGFYRFYKKKLFTSLVQWIQETYPINQSTVSRRYSGNRSSLPTLVQTNRHWESSTAQTEEQDSIETLHWNYERSLHRNFLRHWPLTEQNQNVKDKCCVCVARFWCCKKLQLQRETKRGHFLFSCSNFVRFWTLVHFHRRKLIICSPFFSQSFEENIWIESKGNRFTNERFTWLFGFWTITNQNHEINGSDWDAGRQMGRKDRFAANWEAHVGIWKRRFSLVRLFLSFSQPIRMFVIFWWVF